MAHPDECQLLDVVEGRAAIPVRRRVLAHVRTCESCRSELHVWRSLLGEFRAAARDAPPEALSRWAEDLPRMLAGRVSRVGAVLRLVADSWGAFRDALGIGAAGLEPVPALRSTGGSSFRMGRRRLLLSANQFDLDLEIDYTGPEDPRRIRGQILPVQGPRHLWRGASVILREGRREEARGRVDRRGEFILPRVKPGRYRIEVSGPTPSTSAPVEV